MAASMLALQEEMVRAREQCIDGVHQAFTTLYPDREPPQVRALAEAVAAAFSRGRFADAKELEDLKQVAADAASLLPAEFLSAKPAAVKAAFRKKEQEKKAAAAF